MQKIVLGVLTLGHGGSFHDLAMRGRALDPAAGGNASSSRALSAKTGTTTAETPSFWDFLDVVNPLQHIPVINTLYRAVSGDQIGAVARTIGGALFGGPLGLVASVFDNMVEQTSGKDFGEQVASLFGGDGDKAIDQLPERTELAKQQQPATGPDAVASADMSGLNDNPPVASSAPLDITIRPSDIPNVAARQSDAAASVMKKSIRVPGAVTMAAAETAPPIAQTLPVSQPAASVPVTVNAEQKFIPLGDKVRRVPSTVKFRTVPGLSTSQVLNPHHHDNAVSNAAIPAEAAKVLPPAVPATPVVKNIDPLLNQTAITQSADMARQNLPQATPPVDISERMAKALEKYQAMQKMGQPAAPQSTP